MFALSIFTGVVSFVAQGLAFVSLPFYFEEVLHRNPIDTGFLMMSWPIVVTLGAPIAGRLSDRYPPGILGGIGLLILSVGLALLAMLPSAPHTLDIVLRMMVCGVGFSMFQSPNLRAIMSSAPAERSGGASGMVGVVRLSGQAIGAALVALCFSLAGTQGASWALAIGAVAAGLGATASIARLWAR
jgi:DHA2 family multidrug resistance protein-like MFS transporter